MSDAIITLTTDFGLDSPYTASMKGVILSLHPDARLVDISHSVPPQDVRHGGWVLAEATPRFPAGTIHVAVIDPGVGTERKIIYAEIGDQRYVAPDNGLLGRLARRAPPTRIIALRRREFWLEPVSDTFHGRDIMAPVAARLSLGLDPARLGEPFQTLFELDWPKARVEPRQIVGQVLWIDSFGNLITNIRREELDSIPSSSPVQISCSARSTDRLVRTYAEAPQGSLVALVGSGGELEMAVVGGNAARGLGLGLGEEVIVSW